ncbi:MAG TPA: hypothetical protein VGI25_08125 [Candidatus Udaeobacter sp.]
MKRHHATTPTAMIAIAAGLMTLLAFPIQKTESAMPTIKVPGPYPYETPVQVPVPPPNISEAAVPTPAPFTYRESSPSVAVNQDRDSRAASSRHALTTKAVREEAFKYNGVPYFCEFLAALPADVSVFDPKLGRTRTLVKAGHVQRKNVVWLQKRKQAHAKSNDRTLVSTEELGAREPGI